MDRNAVAHGKLHLMAIEHGHGLVLGMDVGVEGGGVLVEGFADKDVGGLGFGSGDLEFGLK